MAVTFNYPLDARSTVMALKNQAPTGAHTADHRALLDKMWTIYTNVGLNALSSGDLVVAERMFQAAIGEAKRTRLSRIRLAESFANMGSLMRRKDDFDSARRNFLQAWAYLRAQNSENTFLCLHILDGIADAYFTLGDLVHAKRFLRRAIRLREELLGNKHRGLARRRLQLANVLSRMGDYDTALIEYNHATEVLQKPKRPADG